MMIDFKTRLRRFVFDVSLWVILGTGIALSAAFIALLAYFVFTILPEVAVVMGWLLFWSLLAAVTYRRRSI